MRCVKKRAVFLWLPLMLFSGVCLYALNFSVVVYRHGNRGRPDAEGAANGLKMRYTRPVGNSGELVYRFVLGLNYWEQFNMALHNFFKLASLASLWQSQAVIPFTYSSRLYGLRNYKPDNYIDMQEEALSLSAIYDLESMDSVVARLGLPPLASFEDFLSHAHRGLVVVHFVAEKAAHEIPVLEGEVKGYLEEGFSRDNVIDCRSHLTEFTDQLLKSLNHEALRYKVPLFRVDRYFCINMSHLTTPQALATKIGIHDANSNISVIVFNWRGNSDKAVLTDSAKGSHGNNRVMMSSPNIPIPDPIAHSNRVVIATRRYMEHLNLTGNYIVIHLRSEKMGFREKRFPGSTKKCLSKVLELRDDILSHNPTLRTITVTDYGPYSSDSCRKCKGRSIMSKLLSHEERVGLSPVQYDPVALGEVGDRGFAAAVEMRMMASATFLLVSGGGAYQNQLALRFLKDQAQADPSRGQKLFMVCVDDAGVSELVKE